MFANTFLLFLLFLFGSVCCSLFFVWDVYWFGGFAYYLAFVYCIFPNSELLGYELILQFLNLLVGSLGGVNLQLINELLLCLLLVLFLIYDLLCFWGIPIFLSVLFLYICNVCDGFQLHSKMFMALLLTFVLDYTFDDVPMLFLIVFLASLSVYITDIDCIYFG